MTRGVARASAEHPWRTIAAWVVAIAIAVVAVGALLGDRLTSEGHVTNDPDSLRGYDLIAERLPERESFSELVVVRSERFTVDAPEFRSFLREMGEAAVESGAVGGAPSGRNVVSRDRHAALIALTPAPPEDERIEDVIELVNSFDARENFAVSITGEFTLDRDFGEVSERDLQNGELRFGLPAALVVLVLVFGALVAAFLPLVLAIVSILVALGLTALVAQQWELSLFVVNMLTGMGLALGIDYALFVVSRFREERARAREKLDAIEAAGATANRAVLFSGSAFVLAMLGLLLVQSTIMRSLALGAILVGIVSVAAALTLLPATLSLLGDRVNALRVPVVGRRLDRAAAQESRMWGAIVRRVTARPGLSLGLAAGVLVLAALPALGMNIGAAGISTLPDDLVSKRGFLALQQSFPEASADPAYVVVDGGDRSAVAAGVARLRQTLGRDDDFGPVTMESNPSDDLVLMSVPLAGDPLGDRAVEAIRTLRADYVPAAFGGAGADVYVTGTTAENIDYFDVMGRWLPIVLLFVLGLSFVLLTVAFRSVVIAATAIVLNLLSVGATYGLVVLVFQEGIGVDLLGFQQVDTVEAWVPLFLFAVLFGLSMDYQVFLLSRIRERYSQTGDNRDAVTFGIGSTARIITGAALIIVAVFLGFAMGDLVMFQQMGFGIAVALLIDATIVRSVLVPAAMQLLGERNWYLPPWLDWLPHVEVEGHAEDVPETAPTAAPAP